MFNESNEVLSVAEVASELRCSKPHVLNCVHGRVKGVTPLAAIFMGRRTLIRRKALEAWLEENSHPVSLSSDSAKRLA